MSSESSIGVSKPLPPTYVKCVGFLANLFVLALVNFFPNEVFNSMLSLGHSFNVKIDAEAKISPHHRRLIPSRSSAFTPALYNDMLLFMELTPLP